MYSFFDILSRFRDIHHFVFCNEITDDVMSGSSMELKQKITDISANNEAMLVKLGISIAL